MSKVGEYKRAGCSRCGGKKLPGMGQMFCAVCKPIAAAERKEKHRQHDLNYKRRTRVLKPKVVKEPKSKPAQNKVPAEIRQAWSRAHPNSAMRRKFPTPKSLQDHNWEEEAA